MATNSELIRIHGYMISSNTNDYVSLWNDKYMLNGYIQITELEFNQMKGLVPVKWKKIEIMWRRYYYARFFGKEYYDCFYNLRNPKRLWERGYAPKNNNPQ